jgi:tetratricopeptide (TPR) repeat protein
LIRPASTSSNAPQPYKESDSDFLDYGFSRHTQTSLVVFVKLAKYTIYGLVFTGSAIWAAFESTHLWIEHVALAPNDDPDARAWEWDRAAPRWSGGAGGTDAALGFAGRHSARAAWTALHWGVGGDGGARMRPGAQGGHGVVDGALEFAHDLLAVALRRADESERAPRLHPGTRPALLARHAAILELMGTRDALFEARDALERVWAIPPPAVPAPSDADTSARARLALKLGDLNGRLGDREDALAWWARAITLAQGKTDTPPAVPTVPTSAPASPLAQRTLASTLVSLSAFYATSGALAQARATEDAALALLDATRKPVSLSTAPAAEALHSLFLLHRAALLRVHLAEVSYGLRSTAPNGSAPADLLRSAADASERVALALAGLPLAHPDAPGAGLPHPPAGGAPLAPAFGAGARVLRAPAAALLRDARRSAAEAWGLLGVLAEDGPGGAPAALDCYERALGWAGVGADRAGSVSSPAEGVLEKEWGVLWANYVRTREVVRKQEGRR